MPFNIKIPCKSYSKHYLEMKYDDPVNLIKDKVLYRQLVLSFHKKSNKYRKRYEALAFSNYNESVTIVIKRNDFYRYGWDLTRTEIVEFNQAVEMRAKEFMRSYIGSRVAVGYNWTDAINDFQTEYGFTEDIWTFEAIRKECQRNLNIDRGELFKNLLINFNIVI